MNPGRSAREGCGFARGLQNAYFGEFQTENLMRNYFRALALLLVFALPLFAQEEPIPPQRTKMAKVGLFGGAMPAVLFPDLGPLNDQLKAAGAATVSDNGVFMYGGGGAIYIMLIPNVRVGGMGM